MGSSTTPPDQSDPSSTLEANLEAGGLQRGAEHQPPPRKTRQAKTAKTKTTKMAPLPATVQVRGYEITIPSTKTCWRVSIAHSCGHPVMDFSKVRYPGCDTPLIVEINRHMRPCTEKCKVERMKHTVEDLCDMCRQSNHVEDGRPSRFGPGDVAGLDMIWHDLNQL